MELQQLDFEIELASLAHYTPPKSSAKSSAIFETHARKKRVRL
jgi:hypothetical protein